MMAPYPQNNFYDPVGSQPAQPSGYTYANTNSQYPSQNNNTYQSNYNQNYGSNYDNQYATSDQQQSSSSNTNAAAAGLSSLSTQNYSQPASSSTSRSNVAYDTSNSTWGTQNNYAANAYNTSTSRTQANQSPLYATQSSGSTFGRLSLPDQSQSSSNTYAGTQNYQNPTSTTTAQSSSSGSGSRSYRNAPNSAGYKNTYQPPQQQTQQPPQRYASPLHAMQAQQQQQQQSGHNKQPSRSSNQTQPSPQVAARNLQQHRQQSASVEPMTVDPSQVYDIRAEREKQARIDAEKRRKYEAEQAAKKTEEDAKQAEEDARKAEEERIANEAPKAEDDARKAREAEAKKKATAERKKEARRKAKEAKQSNTAATALQQLSSGGGGGGSSMDMMAAMMGNMSGPPANDEEAEMRAMFKKMREFNQKNPAMLAKLWEEERKQHAAQSSPSPAQPAQPVQTVAPPPPAPKLTKKQQKAAATAAASAAANAPPAQPTAPSFNQTALALPTKPTPAPATPSQGSAALWPPHKKGSLAEAAAKWLTALPENRNSGKSIDREQVLKILDTNPSYVQLCEAVEKTGVRFERSALAKELLKAVPDGLRGGQSGVKAGASTVPNVTEANGTPALAPPKKKGRPKKDEPGRYSLPRGRGSGSGGTVSYSAPKFNSLTDAAREVNSMTTTGGMFSSTVSGSISNAYIPATQDPTFYTPPIVVNDTPPPSASQPPEVKPEQKPSEPPPPPKDKEEAARKRGFGDLVDLTAGDSDDEGPPRKVFVPPAGPANGVVKPVPSNDGFRQPMSYQQFIQQNKAQPARPPAASAFGFGQPGPSYSASRPPPFGPQQIWNGPKMQPAAPTPPPVQPQNRPKGPTEEQKQAERIRGKMLVEPIMRDRVARKSKYDSRTIARDVLLATGRHPDMRALNGHLNIMQKMLGDHGGVIDGAGNKSDLSTIRWDLIDPGEPTEDAKSKAKSATNREEDDLEDADVEDDSTFHARQRSSSAGLTGKVPNPNFERKKKASVGRPRKSLNADRDSSLRDASSAEEHPELTSDLSPHISRATPTSRRGSTASNYTPKTGYSRRTASRMSKAAPPPTAGTPTGYAALRPVDENGNPIKKKGRPVGWRKNIHSREAQGLTPKKSGVYEPKTSSKLRQSTGARESSEVVEPHYQVFPCRWRDCNAELDNLEKLKKHTLKLHGDANGDGDFECRWRDCGSGVHIDAVGNERTGDAGVTSFETLDHWFKHVNKAHIQPIAWRLGDGPRGGSVHETRNDSAAYLSDASGRSVTPIVLTPQEFAKRKADAGAGAVMDDVQSSPARIGTMPPPAVKRKPGRPPKNQEAFGLQSLSLDKTEREAAAELKKLADQKLHEGVTMGLEGSRLVNEKRRRGFLDDEDFADFIQEGNGPGF